MPKINQEEYEILKTKLREGYKWVAKEMALNVWVRVYKEHPDIGFPGIAVTEANNLFQFIQWEDEEPFNIAELIEEYESEETEVKKDKKWFVDKWTKERNKTDVHDPMYHFINEFIADVDQLDEPEVLSREWIDEHEEQEEMYGSYGVPVRKLQNLLVPKQELPVIPNYVAKWISVHHERFDLYPALKRLESNALSWENVYEWYRRNTHTFVNAYLTGKYEVEKEQKYQVIIRDGEYMRLYLCKHDGIVTIGTNDNYIEKYPEVTYLTEQEIKDYDERYFAFAVKVEELEE